MDKELEDLLDSALNDFDEKLLVSDENAQNKKNNNNVTIEHTNLYVDDVDYEDRPARTSLNNASKPTTTTTTTSTTGKATNSSASKLSDENMKMFDEIFNDEKTKESMHKFKEAFEMFQSGGDESKLLQNFQKMMNDLVNEGFNLDDDEVDDENIDDAGFAPEEFEFLSTCVSPKKENKNEIKTSENSEGSSNKETDEKMENKEQFNPLKRILEDLNKNSEKLLKNKSGLPFSDEFLSSLTGGALESGNDDENLDAASSLMMQPVISMLFSKDILYPSLKMMSENFEKYIETNRVKLDEESLKKCFAQKECIEKMCIIYEASTENDSKEAKAEQLKNILDLLEKCGMPPSELVPDVNPFEGIGDQMKENACPIS